MESFFSELNKRFNARGFHRYGRKDDKINDLKLIYLMSFNEWEDIPGIKKILSECPPIPNTDANSNKEKPNLKIETVFKIKSRLGSIFCHETNNQKLESRHLHRKKNSSEY
jgi:hypothetical protein